jgi:hypothetical protein
MPISFVQPGGDFGGTGFSRCDNKRLLHVFFAQAKAYATQGRNQTLAQVANLPHICL